MFRNYHFILSEMITTDIFIENIWALIIHRVGLKRKISKEPQLLYFGTANFELFRFQSI